MSIRLGVLRGGPSNEYDVSLATGATVLEHASKDKYQTHDIYIDRGGVWHMHGMPTSPDKVFHRVDVLFNALHGKYGEDGTLQHILEYHKVPFTGSGSLASAIGMNKILSKKIFTDHNIRTPIHKVIEYETYDHRGLVDIFRTFPMPAIVKPARSGSSVGVAIVRDFVSFEEALDAAFAHDDMVIIEEFIPGVEATCGVVEGLRDHDMYALPPVEIRPHGGAFFDYDAKYRGKSDEIVPSTFAHEVKEALMHAARSIHTALGLRHYSRSDFIIHPKRGIYALETNTLPGLTTESLLPKSLKAVGIPLSEFIDHVVDRALEHKR